MKIADAEYFKWEDTGKALTRELINFKFRVHQLLPASLREQVFAELDNAIDEALTTALNFDQLEVYNQMNETYSEFAKTSPNEQRTART